MLNVVKRDGAAVLQASARPLPRVEGALQRRAASVAIQVGVALPDQIWLIEVERQPRRRSEWLPKMIAFAFAIDGDRVIVRSERDGGCDLDGAA